MSASVGTQKAKMLIDILTFRKRPMKFQMAVGTPWELYLMPSVLVITKPPFFCILKLCAELFKNVGLINLVRKMLGQ